MSRRLSHLPRAALLAADAVAAIAAACSAYALRFHAGLLPVRGRTDVLPARYASALPLGVAVLLAASAAAGLYGSAALGRRATPREALRAGVIAVLAMSTAALLYWKEFQYSRLVIVGTAVFYVPFLLWARRASGALMRARRARSALLVGGGAPAEALARALAASPWLGVHVTAVLPVGETPAAWADLPRLGDVTQACALLADGRAQETFVALPAAETARLPALLDSLEQVPSDVRVVPDLGGAALVNPSAAVLSGLVVVAVRERPLYGARAAAKRALDVALSALLLVALSPVLLCVAALVKLTSRGPVLYAQERMGLDGRAFVLLKFRTMRADAEAHTGPVFARPGDPRATPVGRVLRRLSLDELPQLFNVLRGEMSLVGPRPERPPFIEEFRRRLPGYMLRHSVKAGMTGWAQVHGLRGDSSLEERLRYDLDYIDRWSLLLDLEILGRTAVQVVAGRNAC